MGIQSLQLTQISRIGTFGQNDLLSSSPPSQSQHYPRVIQSMSQDPMDTLPLGILVWLLDFLKKYKYITIKIIQILIFFFLLCILVCVCMCWGVAPTHACGGHTWSSEDNSQGLLLLTSGVSSLVGSWTKLGLSVCLEMPLFVKPPNQPFFPFSICVRSSIRVLHGLGEVVGGI